MPFEDTWEWNIDAEQAYQEIVEHGGRISDAMRAFRTFLGNSNMMLYLAMMAPTPSGTSGRPETDGAI